MTAQTLLMAILTLGIIRYDPQWTDLSCRGPHNSIGARRHIIFVDSYLKIPISSLT